MYKYDSGTESANVYFWRLFSSHSFFYMISNQALHPYPNLYVVVGATSCDRIICARPSMSLIIVVFHLRLTAAWVTSNNGVTTDISHLTTDN